MLRIEHFGNRTLTVERVDSGMGTFEDVATLREGKAVVWTITIPQEKHWEGSAAIIAWVEQEKPALIERWSRWSPTVKVPPQ